MVKFDDTKGVIRSVNLRRTDNTMVKFDDTKGVIRKITKEITRSCTSMKDRQHHG
jgi:ribosomal protein L14